MIIYEIEDAKVTERTWQKDGRSGVSRSQMAYAATYDMETGKRKKYPVETKIRLAADQLPYAPGLYMLSPASLYVGEYDAMQVSPQLITAEAFMQMIASDVAQLKKQG